MKLQQEHFADTRGAVFAETAFTLTAFILLTLGVVQCALLWTQVALQHGVEMAARCAGMYQTTLCATANQIKSFAATSSLGLNPPTSTFTVTKDAACGINATGNNLVNGSYSFNFLPVSAQVTVTAKSCYPCAKSTC